jgi:hypothetical protein
MSVIADDIRDQPYHALVDSCSSIQNLTWVRPDTAGVVPASGCLRGSGLASLVAGLVYISIWPYLGTSLPRGLGGAVLRPHMIVDV